ncbi:hypothetical protein V497_05409 [Pseudogymnoascus sp. VKM F-4516 (FW-969)]|nr:hypothetical protein V497_05409 [Pseudogymnoascus sp. VKM F-4516 (FW-969)]
MAIATSPTPSPTASASALTSSDVSMAAGGIAAGEQGGLPAGLDRKRGKACRFYGTGAGCRAGQSCPFVHDESRPATRKNRAPRSAAEESGSDSNPQSNTPLTTSRVQAVTKPVPSSRVVPKPIPQAQAQDPREFQLGQIRRRYKPRERKSEDGATILEFDLKPSDPDFPFEMTALACLLVVPQGYPEESPSLRVRNSDIPRGYTINVERGFDGLVEARTKSMTLLALMGALDKNLEAFLSEKKADTIKLVANADKRHLENLPVRAVNPEVLSSTSKGKATQAPKSVAAARHTPRPAPVYYSKQQKEDAQAKRASETRQLESRLGRLPLYKRSGDGIAYTLPIEPRKRGELPVALRSIKTIVLFVPILYPLQNCRITLEGVKPEDAKATEAGFEERAKKEKESTLMGHVNYMAQNMHVLAKTPLKAEVVEKPVVPEPEPVEEIEAEQAPQVAGVADEERSHIFHIPRPPEWAAEGEGESEESDGSDYSYDSEDFEGGYTDEEGEGEQDAPQPLDTTERGTALSFPYIELYGMELLETTVLNLTIKCERCRDTTDITGLRNGVKKTESCRKCATVLGVTFRHDLIHTNAIRAGFLDLEGCVPVDMLPSTFLPTCSTCSEPFPTPGIVAHAANTITINCRHCHASMTLKLTAPKFLRITSAAMPASGPRRKRDMLHLHPGEALPLNGRCTHYAKSYRWFRFSCCNKVYACDRCHDEKEEHPNERAERMVCGWCSREQAFRKEDCRFCGRGLIRKRGGGFWEGGKGTRDKAAMSRKDPRKYKRRGGGALAKKKD